MNLVRKESEGFSSGFEIMLYLIVGIVLANSSILDWLKQREDLTALMAGTSKHASVKIMVQEISCSLWG